MFDCELAGLHRNFFLEDADEDQERTHFFIKILDQHQQKECLGD